MPPERSLYASDSSSRRCPHCDLQASRLAVPTRSPGREVGQCHYPPQAAVSRCGGRSPPGRADLGTDDVGARIRHEQRPESGVPGTAGQQKIDFETGKPSLTHFQVLERNHEENWTRVDLEPYTGRSHQLRMHLMALGHPILGDPLYADPETFVRATRMTLHAKHLDLEHPLTGQQLSFDSPVPF